MAYDSEHGKLWQDIKADVDKTKSRASKFAAAAEWAFGKKTARVLGVVGLFAVVIILLFLLLNLYVAPTKPSEKKDLVLAVAQILAGTALLSGLYFTWRTLQVNREGQITERFTRAIDQLGATDEGKNKKLELRLGGIYALERIARESKKDHWSIMEVLTAYVRQHAPWRPEEAQQVKEDPAVDKKAKENSRGESETTEVPAPAADIQAIVTVLRQRTRSFGQGEPEPLDLRETKLTRARLWEANLSRANLWRANLSEADFSGANLSGANLSEANLSGGARLLEANLSGANLAEADLSGTILSGADLSEVINFQKQQLEETGSGDENTQLPPDLKPPAHWNVKTDEQTEGD